MGKDGKQKESPYFTKHSPEKCQNILIVACLGRLHIILNRRDCGNLVVRALGYQPEDLGFKSRPCYAATVVSLSKTFKPVCSRDAIQWPTLQSEDSNFQTSWNMQRRNFVVQHCIYVYV